MKNRILIPLDEKDQRPIEFAVFYWMDIVQLMCLSILYWVAAINVNWWLDGQKDQKAAFILLIILIKYVPNILMTLMYVMLYL